MKRFTKKFIFNLIFCCLCIAALIALLGQENFTKGLTVFPLGFVVFFPVLLVVRTYRYLINKNSTNNSTLKLHELILSILKLHELILYCLSNFTLLALWGRVYLTEAIQNDGLILFSLKIFIITLHVVIYPLIIPLGMYLVYLLLRICRYLIYKDSTLKLFELQHLCNEKAAAPQLLEALRSYLTSKLKAKTNLSTYNDLKPLLQERKVSETLQQEIKQLLEELEAADYEGEQDTSPHNDVKNEHALYRYWITEQYTTLHNAVKNVLEKFEKEVK